MKTLWGKKCNEDFYIKVEHEIEYRRCEHKIWIAYREYRFHGLALIELFWLIWHVLELSLYSYCKQMLHDLVGHSLTRIKQLWLYCKQFSFIDYQCLCEVNIYTVYTFDYCIFIKHKRSVFISTTSLIFCNSSIKFLLYVQYLFTLAQACRVSREKCCTATRTARSPTQRASAASEWLSSALATRHSISP